ncbi:MAG: glycosyltransferase [Patescibacteria group bacterium]|nr:glycosyltransferase [Patescibacteria group bacterium]
MNFKATIIILDFLKAPQVLENMESLLEQKVDFNFKNIIIDNSCNKKNADILKQLEKYKNIKIKINKKNSGYPKAHNDVKNEIDGDYILIVNPDILWKKKNIFAKLINYMDNNQDIGILGPKQINRSGKVEMTIRAFPKIYLQVARRTFLRYLPILKSKVKYDEMQHLDYNKIQDVDWLQSSCVVIRKKLWDKVNGLCEDYFLFMSDVEICFQAWENNYRVVYFSKTEVCADGKRSSAGGFNQFFKSGVLRQHLKDSIKYRVKHFFDKNPRKKI